MTVNARLFETYAFVTPPRQITVRDVEVYAFHTEVAELPLGVTGKRAVFNLINALALAPFTEGQLTIGLPRAEASPKRNSAVSVSGAPGTPWSGSTDFYYNRLSVGDAFLPIGGNVSAPASAQTVHALIPSINARTGWVLTSDDLVDGPATGTQVTLTATDRSYFFLPDTTKVINLVRT